MLLPTWLNTLPNTENSCPQLPVAARSHPETAFKSLHNRPMIGDARMNIKGLDFARYALARAVAGPDAADWAARQWGRDLKPAAYTKAAIGAQSSDSPLSGDVRQAAAEFIELVRSETILGRLQGMRRVPSDTAFLKQTGTTQANWVGEGQPMPISNATFERDNISLLKIAALTVSTIELLEAPGAEMALRDDLVRVTAEAMDLAFIDPANAGVTDRTPASITNGLTPVASTASDADGYRSNLSKMIAQFEGDLGRAVLVGRPQLFVQMHSADYPNIGARGGELAGLPAFASKGLPNDANGNYRLALIDPGEIIFTGMQNAEVKISEAGTIEMDSNSTSDALAGTGTNQVSLFQANAKAIAAMIAANWERQRDNSVVLLDGIAGTESV